MFFDSIVLKFETGTASFVQLKSLNLMAVMLQRHATRERCRMNSRAGAWELCKLHNLLLGYYQQ